MGSGSEFDRIRAIIGALGMAAGPIGDDTAAVPVGEGKLVVSTDCSVENIHFKRQWLSLPEIGWRAAASALSDLAAAAAEPAGIVVALVVPTSAADDAAADVMRGVGDAASSVGATVLGGDLSSGSEWVIAVTVFGWANPPMSRRGAQPGDGIWVTGTLGGARAALEAWLAGAAPDDEARSKFAHPIPRIAEARWLAQNGATSMMDLSDGLGGDAQHLAAASAVRLQVELESLPLHPSVDGAARTLRQRAELFAAAGGEDYELLLTLPARFNDAGEFTATFGIPLTRVGKVVTGTDAEFTLAGRAHVVHGFRHAL